MIIYVKKQICKKSKYPNYYETQSYDDIIERCKLLDETCHPSKVYDTTGYPVPDKCKYKTAHLLTETESDLCPLCPYKRNYNGIK